MNGTGCTEQEARDGIVAYLATLCTGAQHDPMCKGTCGAGTNALGEHVEGKGSCRTNITAAGGSITCEPAHVKGCPHPPLREPVEQPLNGVSCTVSNMTGTCGCTCVEEGDAPGSLVAAGEEVPDDPSQGPACRAKRGTKSFPEVGLVNAAGCTKAEAQQSLQQVFKSMCTGPSDPYCDGYCEKGRCAVSVTLNPNAPIECFPADVSGCRPQTATATSPSSTTTGGTSSTGTTSGTAGDSTCRATRQPDPFALWGRIVTMDCDEGAARAALYDRINSLGCQGPSHPGCTSVACSECVAVAHINDQTHVGCWRSYSPGCGATSVDPATGYLSNAWTCQAFGAFGTCSCECASPPASTAGSAQPPPAAIDAGPPTNAAQFSGYVCSARGVTGTCACACDS